MELDPISEIINAVDFYLKDGVYIAPANDYFWFMWKNNKQILKDAGISCFKDEELDCFFIKADPRVYTERYIEKVYVKPIVDYPPIRRSSFLKPYQVYHTQALIDAFRTGNIVDGSETGIGKTYCSIAVAMEYQYPIFVITPKSVIVQWKRAVNNTGVECHGILNYEALKFGRSEFLKLEVTDDGKQYVWNLPDNTVIIWDEAHRCKNASSMNAQMMIAASKQNIPCMTLSATLADRPDHFGAIGPLLGLFHQDSFYGWMMRHGMFFKKIGDKRPILEFSGSKYHLWKIHKLLYPQCGHRVTKKELGDLFPNNLIIAEACEMDNAAKITKVIEKMKKELRALERKKQDDLNQDHPLTVRLRARQEIELLKVPTFVELAEDAIEEGNSVIIFVNFVETLVSLQHHLKTDSVVKGGQKPEERQKILDDFQDNKTNIIILVIQAGSVGIDLHDTHGSYPRLSLISPSDRSLDLYQAFGRPHRSGGMSPVLQKIIFAAGTVEEKVRDNVERKLENMEMINDGDLSLEE